MTENVLSGPLLCIDTSIPTGSVGVVGAGETGIQEVRTGPNARAENLFPEIKNLLEHCGLEPAAIGGVAVARGPGSFTGLRIAASTAKTLAWSLGKPLFAAGSLLCQAHRAAGTGLPVCAAFDAGRDEFYAACYRWNDQQSAPGEIIGPGAWDLDSLCRLLEPVAGGGKLVLLGQGYLKSRQVLDDRLAGILHHVDEQLHQPDAASLGNLVLKDPESYLVSDILAFEPDYIRVGQAGLRLSR